jgi:hypothetical protein
MRKFCIKKNFLLVHKKILKYLSLGLFEVFQATEEVSNHPNITSSRATSSLFFIFEGLFLPAWIRILILIRHTISLLPGATLGRVPPRDPCPEAGQLCTTPFETPARHGVKFPK